MKKYSRNIKGIALIWAILLTLVIMIISSTIASYTIKESRMTINISDSTQAYSDAKSGTEWAYFYLKSIPSPLLTPASYTLDFGTTGTAAITITPDLPTTGDYTIDSTGQYGGIERKIEQVVNPSVGASVAFGSNAFTPSTSTSGSFEFGFTFTPVTAGSNSFNLTNGSGTSVGIQKSGSNWNLQE